MAKKTRRRANGEGSIFERTFTRKDGSTYKRWVSEVTVGIVSNGTPKHKTVYGSTQREVLEKKAAIEHRVKGGTYSETRMSVADYVGKWLEQKRLEVKPRTHEFYETYTRLYILPNIGGYKLASLSSSHIRDALAKIHSQVSADAANKTRTTLFGALKQAMLDGLIPKNPVEVVKPYKVTKKKDPKWEPEEAEQFLEAITGHRLFAAFHIAISTGLRHGEVLGLRWQDFYGDALHIEQSLINYRAMYAISSPKTEEGKRIVLVDPDTAAIIRDHRLKQEQE
jgi:integrase